MDFCQKCSNMYYMKIDESKNLIHFCKNCGYEDTNILDTKNLKVLKFSKEFKNKDVHINEYTKFDPTLPHVHTIKCPNVDCPSNTSTDIEQDVIYLRYDDKHMKFMYLCVHCDFNWVH